MDITSESPSPTPDEPPRKAPEQKETPDLPVEREEAPERKAESEGGVYVAIAVGSAILAALLTATVFWLSGAFDREEVQITEVIEFSSTETTTSTLINGDSTPSTLPEPKRESQSDPSAVSTLPVLGTVDLVAEVAARTIPSIVTVQSLDGDGGLEGSGSGVVIRSDGFIVTNQHVIEDANELRVIMSDGLSYPAELVGADPLMDIAVIKLEATDLPPIAFGTMDGLRTGAPAIAVGNPLGLDGGPSVTAGVISAFDRSLVTDFLTGETLFGLLQTDAPITRGSSGGALLDSEGRLLGITTAIGLSDVGAEGLGFAIPINLLEGIVQDLMSTGEVQHAFLGIRGSSALDELDQGVASPLGVAISLLEDSAIGAAGAEEGDVIVALDGVPVRSMPLLVARLREYRAGDRVMVTLQREDEQFDIRLTLDRYPS